MVLVEGRRRLERGVGGREKWVSGKEVDGNVGGKEKRVGNEGGRVRYNKWKYGGGGGRDSKCKWIEEGMASGN